MNSLVVILSSLLLSISKKVEHIMFWGKGPFYSPWFSLSKIMDLKSTGERIWYKGEIWIESSLTFIFRVGGPIHREESSDENQHLRPGDVAVVVDVKHLEDFGQNILRWFLCHDEENGHELNKVNVSVLEISMIHLSLYWSPIMKQLVRMFAWMK